LFSRNDRYYERLPAYLEEELDPAQNAQMTARLAVDPALSLEAQRLRPLLEALRKSKSREAVAPVSASSVVPGDLWLRLQDRLNPAPVRRPARQYGWLAGVGATAALAVIVALRLPQSMPTEPHPAAPPISSAPQLMSKPLNQTTDGAAKIAKTNVAPASNASGKASASSVLPTRPVPSAKSTPPPTVGITSGGNDPFASLPVAVPAPISRTSPAPAPPRANKVPTAVASEPSRSHISGEVNVIAPGRAASITAKSDAVPAAIVPGEAPAPAAAPGLVPLPAQREVLQTTVQAQAAPPASRPHTEERARQGGATTMGGGATSAVPVVPYTKNRVFNRTKMLPMEQRMVPVVSLETEQAALSAAVQAPLWGEDSGATLANQALMAVREAGQLDTLRSRLEARREQSPQDIGTGRMLAAIYEFGFQSDLALRERRRIVAIAGAGGEDWFALALAEARAGNTAAAKTDYRNAAESPIPLNSFHAAQARQRG
jgi:hypothetical protein